jgi:hypothetical protein
MIAAAAAVDALATVEAIAKGPASETAKVVVGIVAMEAVRAAVSRSIAVAALALFCFSSDFAP